MMQLHGWRSALKGAVLGVMFGAALAMAGCAQESRGGAAPDRMAAGLPAALAKLTLDENNLIVEVTVTNVDAGTAKVMRLVNLQVDNNAGTFSGDLPTPLPPGDYTFAFTFLVDDNTQGEVQVADGNNTVAGTVENGQQTNVSTAGLTYVYTDTDGDGDTNIDELDQGTPVDNQHPNADAGADQTADTGGTVNLSAAGSSDPENETLTFAWTQTGGTSVTLSDDAAEAPSFTAPPDTDTLTFQVEVSDGHATDTDTVFVHVVRASAALKAGSDHACSLEPTGELWCWGTNWAGQVGDGTTDIADVPVRVSIPADTGGTLWQAVGLGAYHSCAIKDGGTLWCWGYNGNGQLGVGGTTEAHTPLQVGTDSDWAEVDGGGNFTCARKTDNTLWCWGYNGNGQVGDGTTTSRDKPVQEAGADTDWATVSTGGNHACALKTGGTLWCWGYNGNGQLGDNTTTNQSSPSQLGAGTDWTAVAAGGSHTCALKADTGALCWGYNGQGQLGDGTNTEQHVPTPVQDGADYSAISTGTYASHNCGIKTDGTLHCWGNNGSGQLGDGTNLPSSSPLQVGTDTGWAIPAAGSNFTCAVYSDQTVWCWGEDSSGQLGDGPAILTPRTVAGNLSWSEARPGAYHTCGVATDGTLWCWGYNGSGQIGDGTNSQANDPVQVGTDTDWKQVSAGANHTCAIKTTGTLWCWGNNGSGQLGTGGTTPSKLPLQVGTDTDWKQVSTGASHTCALKGNNIFCWGYNGNGRLGDGTTTQRTSPTQVGTDTWVAVSAGSSHSCGVRSDFRLYCWGYNGSGQLGNGTTTDSASPAEESTFAQNWSRVAASGSHTCATRNDNTLFCWGYNGNGQLGDGTNTNSSSPVQVGIDEWAQGGMSAGVYGSHTCARKTDGTLFCWGYNGNGQLGDGTTTAANAPVQVGTDTDWANVGAGGSHTCGVKDDGSALCWGADWGGQLGDGGSRLVMVLFP